ILVPPPLRAWGNDQGNLGWAGRSPTVGLSLTWNDGFVKPYQGDDPMEQLFFTGHGQVEWRDIRPPKLAGDKDALVRPVAVATCDLDTAVVHGAAPFPGPFPLGHEGVAEVVEVGSDVTAVSAGQRVIVPFQVSCGRCARCRRGLTGSCESVPFGAM